LDRAAKFPVENASPRFRSRIAFGDYLIEVATKDSRAAFVSGYTLTLDTTPLDSAAAVNGEPKVEDQQTGSDLEAPVTLAPASGGLTVICTGDAALTQSAEHLVRAAYASWVAALGYQPQLAVTLSLSDLSGEQLGYATLFESGTGLLELDIHGGSRGWYIDLTPYDHSEFATSVSPFSRVASDGLPPGSMISLPSSRTSWGTFLDS
jgi:hypothetical protein